MFRKRENNFTDLNGHSIYSVYSVCSVNMQVKKVNGSLPSMEIEAAGLKIRMHVLKHNECPLLCCLCQLFNVHSSLAQREVMAGI
jgi:hypothetical protein